MRRNRDELRRYHNAMFESVPTHHRIVVSRQVGDEWVLDLCPVKFQHMEAYLYDLNKTSDVYISPTVVGPEADLGGATCGSADDAIGAFGVCSVIPYQVEAHRQDHLPFLEDALEFMHSLPLYPSLMINSGNSLDLYWLFKEFLIFDNHIDLDLFKTLWKNCQADIVARGNKHGWAWDQTQVCPGILRPAGLRNHAVTPPATVQIEEAWPARYTPDVLRAIYPMP